MAYLFDHRQLAEDMALYCMNDDVGPGLPLWLPNGCLIRDKLEQFIKDLERRAGYQRVSSPHLAKEKLYLQSGHLDCFRDDMFPPMEAASPAAEASGSSAREAERYYLRPMNCPHHHLIFASQPRSYRELPLRLAEYGQVYRFEASGALRGLSRVRGLCQNDAHLYVARENALPELMKVLDLHEAAYRGLGLKGYHYRLSLRDPARPADFKGAAQDWLDAEALLRQALVARGSTFVEERGEAAFYGPKIDVQMRMGDREESISSVQLDFLSGPRFGLEYAAADGSKQIPWIIHRAPLGTHERFIALLLEYFDGRLPAWLAPIQIALIPVVESDLEQCRELQQQLLDADVRVHIEQAQGSLGKRIKRAHRLRPVCKLLVGSRDWAGPDIPSDRNFEMVPLAKDAGAAREDAARNGQTEHKIRLEFRDGVVEANASTWIDRLKAELRDPSIE